MGWIEQKPVPHECWKPDATTMGNGSTWQCDDCGQVWEWHREDSYDGWWKRSGESLRSKFVRWFA